jgi:DNA-binding CsgD family transcriptional regulator
MANLRTKEGRPKLFACEVEDSKTPEQKLWLSVLYQGVFEALTFKYNALPLTDTERKETKKWIDLDNQDFKEVCENAGFSPYYVYNQIRKVIKNNELETKIQINPMVAKTIISGTESNPCTDSYESSNTDR